MKPRPDGTAVAYSLLCAAKSCDCSFGILDFEGEDGTAKLDVIGYWYFHSLGGFPS